MSAPEVPTLTPEVLALGHAYLPAVNLGEIAQQELGRVARATGQSSLVTLDGAGIVFIAPVPGSTSSADQLHQVRVQGWVMIDQEVSEGIQSAAAPGRTAAAIGFSWSVAAVDPAHVARPSSRVLLGAASRISEQLGAAFSPPRAPRRTRTPPRRVTSSNGRTMLPRLPASYRRHRAGLARSGHYRDCCGQAPGARPPAGRDIDPDRQRELPGLPEQVGSPDSEHLEQRPSRDGLRRPVRADRINQVASVHDRFDAASDQIVREPDRPLHRHHGRGKICRPQGRHGLAGSLREIDPAHLGGFARRGIDHPGQ